MPPWGCQQASIVRPARHAGDLLNGHPAAQQEP
jgi:hypothetical protein